MESEKIGRERGRRNRGREREREAKETERVGIETVWGERESWDGMWCEEESV